MLKEFGKQNPHQNVEAWLDTVDDLDLAMSVISVREVWKGIEKKRSPDPQQAGKLETAAKEIFAAFQGRILPVDEKVATVWGRLLSESEKHVDDTGLVATAQVHGIVLVTRNVSDVLGRGVAILDPFKAPPNLIKPKP